MLHDLKTHVIIGGPFLLQETSATGVRIRKLTAKLEAHDRDAVNRRAKREIDLFKLAFNPKSFTQVSERQSHYVFSPHGV